MDSQLFQDPGISNWNDTIKQVSVTSEITVHNGTAGSFHGLRNMDLTRVVRGKKKRQPADKEKARVWCLSSVGFSEYNWKERWRYCL